MTPLFAQADFLGSAGVKSVLMHLQLSVRVTHYASFSIYLRYLLKQKLVIVSESIF